MNNLTEKDIRAINGFVDFWDGVTNSNNLQKYKIPISGAETNQLQKESYYNGMYDMDKKWKEKILDLNNKYEKEIKDDGVLTKLNQYNLIRAIINDLEELLEE